MTHVHRTTFVRQAANLWKLKERLWRLITSIYLAPVHVHEGNVLLDLTAGTRGRLVGDRNDWVPHLKETLRRLGIVLLVHTIAVLFNLQLDHPSLQLERLVA